MDVDKDIQDLFLKYGRDEVETAIQRAPEPIPNDLLGIAQQVVDAQIRSVGRSKEDAAKTLAEKVTNSGECFDLTPEGALIIIEAVLLLNQLGFYIKEN